MKKIISILLLSAMAFLATGCGVKGPLYFPETEQNQQKN
ncbi:hypothetical protein B0186_06350 [Canicola haemoglobinophilus]|uniref:Predicted small periplasmic lipoprotein n=1 Tax=Canicola haemoglobinophilus TaxID=733 RepID=A0A1V4B128_9PAST|nr:lipoprotein [Canicola haemoglobinophilus]MBN6711671.1 lipoprotein [Canicola haemoglobinophilus]OOS00458.1 hypothetical protein B0186_06350 [Canicola haemoglobinophilus]STO55211.1 Predicted small periplasmic lipoprotein [Canicola haemoglobinophilus]STO59496.1 Predicted small periplasmic lipoprotein [Canicola haemoglobinophilus]STO69219.1 Predicted small periplasmic lipoprotein [Canicola haemoglobinophilus]